MEKKKCSSCKKEKKLDDFNFKIKEKGIRASKCKTCQSLYSKEHYEGNKEPYLLRARASRKVYRNRNRQFVFEYLKTHPCIDCGESDPIVLDFDHLEMGKKEANISVLSRSSIKIERIINEIQKCEVRCANCHRKRTYKQLGGKYKGKSQ